MKRLAIIFTVVIFAVNAMTFTAFAVPSSLSKEFTLDETSQLLKSATISYNVTWSGASQFPTSGSVIPDIYYLTDSNFSSNMRLLYIPIEGIDTNKFSSLTVNIDFSLPVTKCDTVKFAFAPASLYKSSSSSAPTFYRWHNFIYSVKSSSSLEADYKVNFSSSGSTNFSLLNELNARFYTNRDSHYFVHFASDGILKYSNDPDVIYCQGSNIDSFSIVYNPTIDILATSSNFAGLAFVFAPLSVTWEEGGGYSSGGSVDPEPDPENPDSSIGDILTNPTPSQSEALQSQQSVLSEQEAILSEYESQLADVTLSPEQSEQVSSAFGMIQDVGDDISSAFDDPVGSPFAFFPLIASSPGLDMGLVGSWQTWCLLLVFAFGLVSILLYGRSGD